MAYLVNIGAINGSFGYGSLNAYINVYITDLAASGWATTDTGFDGSWTIQKTFNNKPNLLVKGNLIPDLTINSGYLTTSADYNLGVDIAP